MIFVFSKLRYPVLHVTFARGCEYGPAVKIAQLEGVCPFLTRLGDFELSREFNRKNFAFRFSNRRIVTVKFSVP